MSQNKKEKLSIHDSHDNPGSGNQHGPKRPDSMRRRSLIKASVVAVPTIMTLRSGVVSATSMDCRQKDADVLGVPKITDPDQDNWLRAEANVYSGSGLVAFMGNSVGGQGGNEKTQLENFKTIKDAYDSVAMTNETLEFCKQTAAVQQELLDDWAQGNNLPVGLANSMLTASIMRYEGDFLHITNTDTWYVYLTSTAMYKGLKELEKHFTFCGDVAAAAYEVKEVLCYVTFDDNGHIVIDDIRTYPDSPEGYQQITESCACSIDPMFQMPDG